MSGKQIRLQRLFDRGSNVVVVAVDHGAQFGVLPGIVDLPAAVEGLSGADGILINPGTLDQCDSVFARKDAPVLISRLTWTTSYCFPWGYDQAHTAAVMTPQEALFRGAEMVAACCVIRTGDQTVDAENVRIFSAITRQKEACGLPLIGEFYPVGAERMPEDELHEVVQAGARILWELGADVIKTFYTGRKFAEIPESVPIPVLVLGAAKTAKESDALEMAHRAVSAGARGVVFGRNVFQAKDPGVFLRALGEVVKRGADPSQTARKYAP